MRRLLQMNKLHLNGDERAGGGVWGRYRKRAEANSVLRLTAKFIAEVGWWRSYVQQENVKERRG